MTLQESNSNLQNELEQTVLNKNSTIKPTIFSEQEQEIVRQLKNKNYSTLLIGRTGVGKSSTVNSLTGQEIAPVGDFEPTTMDVKKYESELNGVSFIIYDSPGLCDDLEEKMNDYKYINLMIEKIDKLDSMWFVTRLDDTRVDAYEKRAIKLVSQAFGKEIWQQSMIVFTFAGNVKAEKYPRYIAERTRLIRKEIAKHTSPDIAENVPSVAVDNLCETTPDGKTWLNKLFSSAYKIMSDDGAIPLIVSLLNRIEPPKPKVVYQTRTRVEKVYVERPADSYYQESSSNLQTYQESKPERKIILDERDVEIIETKTREVFHNFTQSHQMGERVGESLGGSSVGGRYMGRVAGGTVGGVVGGAADGAEIGESIAGGVGKFFGGAIGAVGGGIIGFFKSC